MTTLTKFMNNKLTLEKYLEILKLDTASLINYQIEVVSIYEDIDPVEVGNYNLKKLREKSNPIIKLIVSLEGDNYKLNETIETEIGPLYYKSLSTFTLGEYIDLESFLVKEEYDKVLTLLYRQCDKSPYGKDKWEEWGGYSQKRTTLFSDIDVTLLVGALNMIMKEKKDFLNKFKQIFSTDNFNYDDELNNPNLTADEKRIILEEKKKEDVIKSFNFEFMILSYAEGDFTKLEDIVNMNVNVLFKFILVKQQYDIVNKGRK